MSLTKRWTWVYVSDLGEAYISGWSPWSSACVTGVTVNDLSRDATHTFVWMGIIINDDGSISIYTDHIKFEEAR